ncbi:hypothetical protein [Arthrobacter sp. CAN_C5]|uniref:hypothetical protein n=1 Tax=Arthrobacter sp. CAN_C5 TaxID=2760706 RepID=UPI001AE15085|nr:hypothetical protein [Arthrobacter sp. CAN_C5]MBP2217025.1 hypothetical protein [Arthrobacter sp. CAN_C5]
MLTSQTPPVPKDKRADHYHLPAYRMNLMRFGYLVMGVGLVIVRWPDLLKASSLPPMEGVVVSMLVAMSLLAFLGLWRPIAMLPILLFEVAWKLIWLGTVAVPHLLADDMDAHTERLLGGILLVALIVAITPWDYVWKRYVTAPGDRWRRGP